VGMAGLDAAVVLAPEGLASVSTVCSFSRCSLRSDAADLK